MPDTFCKRLIDSLQAHGTRVAMRIVGDEAQVYTFDDLLRGINSIAFGLVRQGIGRGDRVALIGENHPSWAIAYLGIIYRGAVCVPLDPHGEIETLSNFLENSEAKLAFIDDRFVGKFRLIRQKRQSSLKAIVWKSSPSVECGAYESSGNEFEQLENWIGTDVADGYERDALAGQSSDMALLMYTSGTTGTPKGVPLTHGNILAELDGINDVLKISENERILSLLPLFHAYLQIVNLWVATTSGCEVGYLRELSPAELAEAMKSFRPTILTTVPRLWYLFHKKIFDAVKAKPPFVQNLFAGMLVANGILRDSLGVNLGPRLFGKVHASFGGSLRLAVSAGSRFDEDVAIDFHRLGFTILQGYGLTETSGAATATFENDNRVGSVGKPMKGVEIKIASPNNEGVGEVLIRGGVVFGGYYRNPDATTEAFTDDGWFHSGDLGMIDSEGHLFIVGRAKDVIVLPSGKNVHPEDLEVHYLKTPYVAEMAIIGIRDEGQTHAGAEKLVAVVVPDFEYLRREKIANSREIIRFTLDNLGRELPEYQRVRSYIVRSEPLPRTATRKIKRFELKKLVESGTLNGLLKEKREWQFSESDRELMASGKGVSVAAAIAQNLIDVPEIHPDMNLEIDLGLDSLARAELIASLEHKFSVEFNSEKAAAALTFRDLTDLLEQPRSASPALEAGFPEARTAGLNWSRIVRETGDVMPEIRPILRNRILFSAFAFSVMSVFYLFCRIFMRLEVRGLENLQKMEKPFLICPNHQSFLDAFVLSSVYPFGVFRHIFHVGTSGIFKGRIMTFVARILNIVPIDPDAQLMRAMRAGAIGLKQGKILNIYPEGERAFDGNLHEFKKGAAILAAELGLPILPVAIDGMQNVWPRGSRRIRPAKVRIRFGESFNAADLTAVSDANSENEGDRLYAEITCRLKKNIETMIAEMRSPANQ